MGASYGGRRWREGEALSRLRTRGGGRVGCACKFEPRGGRDCETFSSAKFEMSTRLQVTRESLGGLRERDPVSRAPASYSPPAPQLDAGCCCFSTLPCIFRCITPHPTPLSTLILPSLVCFFFASYSLSLSRFFFLLGFFYLSPLRVPTPYIYPALFIRARKEISSS